MELLRLLAMLGAGDKHTSENIYAVVAEVKRRAEPLGNNIGECAKTGGRTRSVLLSVRWDAESGHTNRRRCKLGSVHSALSSEEECTSRQP